MPLTPLPVARFRPVDIITTDEQIIASVACPSWTDGSDSNSIV